MNDLTVQAAPRISATQFARVLDRAKSPAASDAAALYRIPLGRGLDPAVALAFFAHELTYGTAGVAVRSRNWGNLRRGPRALYVANGFAYYAHWTDSLSDWTDLIATTYIARLGLTTVKTILERYAPSSDGNAPARYAAIVATLVARWQVEDGAATATYRVRVAVANVRRDPSTRQRWVRQARLGDPVAVADVVLGEAVEGDPRWAKLADGAYIHASLLEVLP